MHQFIFGIIKEGGTGMTKRQYMRKVEKKLIIPREMKRDVLEKLEESFTSASEQGKTEEQVVDRLGSPAIFVRDVIENIGLTDRQKRTISCQRALRKFILAIGFLAIAVTTMTIVPQFPPIGAIGYAYGPTDIIVVGGEIGPILPIVICAVLWGILAILSICFIIIKKRF